MQCTRTTTHTYTHKDRALSTKALESREHKQTRFVLNAFPQPKFVYYTRLSLGGKRGGKKRKKPTPKREKKNTKKNTKKTAKWSHTKPDRSNSLTTEDKKVARLCSSS